MPRPERRLARRRRGSLKEHEHECRARPFSLSGRPTGLTSNVRPHNERLKTSHDQVGKGLELCLERAP